MSPKLLKVCLPVILLFTSACLVCGQNNIAPTSVRAERYEEGASYNEITEATFRLLVLSSAIFWKAPDYLCNGEYAKPLRCLRRADCRAIVM